MPLPTYILAEIDDGLVKVAIGVIIAIVWGIGALANMAKKQQQGQAEHSRAEMERAMRAQVEAARRNQAAAEALARGRSNAPPPLPGFQPEFQSHQPWERPRGQSAPPMRPRAQPQRPAPARNAPPPLVQPSQRQQAGRPRGPVMPPKRTKKAERRPQQRPVAEPLLEELDSYSRGATRPGVTESEIGAGTAAASPARRLAAVPPMVRLTPQSLRQQFILTEILQPPMALREPR